MCLFTDGDRILAQIISVGTNRYLTNTPGFRVVILPMRGIESHARIQGRPKRAAASRRPSKDLLVRRLSLRVGRRQCRRLVNRLVHLLNGDERCVDGADIPGRIIDERDRRRGDVIG
jgi:hypothetical protein